MKTIYILCVLFFTAAFSSLVYAQGNPNYPSAISINIKGSEDEPTVGSGLGVDADIKNISDSIVTLEGRFITLTLPPELIGPFNTGYTYEAYLPTEWPEYEAGHVTQITLLPGDTYHVYWSPGRGENYDTTGAAVNFGVIGSIVKIVRSELKFIFFSPGNYTLTADVKYWINDQRDYHTITQSTTLHFAAPQSVILFGAALGGLIAFYIFPHSRRRLIMSSKTRHSTFWAISARVGKEIAGIVGAILLSAIVTILLARISETQFLIKVSIADFWGAVAIGFVANYLGARGLEKLLPQLGTASADAKPQAETVPASGGVSAPKKDDSTSESKGE